MGAIQLQGIYKLFGPRPAAGLELAQDGVPKDKVLARTGNVLALADINLSITPGQIFVVMGLSGSGKSTLLRHLNRLVEPTVGQIHIDGVDVLALTDKALREFRQRRMSMVFQGFGLFPHKTVLRNVVYGPDLRAATRQERNDAHARAREWIDRVGLNGYEAAYPHELSGGMQQRVGLARALAAETDILLMDEPFGALDPLIRQDMQDQLLDLQRQFRRTIVFITHDLDEALRLGDQVGILRDGRLLQVGAGEEIVLQPRDAHIADFVRNVNRARVLTARCCGTPPLPLSRSVPVGTALAALADSDAKAVCVLTEDGQPIGGVTAGRLRQCPSTGSVLGDVALPSPRVAADVVLGRLLRITAESEAPALVMDADDRVLKVVTKEDVLRLLAEQPSPDTLESDGV